MIEHRRVPAVNEQQVAQRPRRKSVLWRILALTALLSGCAVVHTPTVQIPPRLVLRPATSVLLRDLEPLPFVKHTLAELEADEAATAHANPEREAREAEAAWKINEFLSTWGDP